MNTISKSVIGFAVLLLPYTAKPQEAAGTNDRDRDEPIQLSSFDVVSEKDVGYRVQNAVATTGIAQPLTKTPLPITVVTEELLRDTGRSGFVGALGYVSSITFDGVASDGARTPGQGRGQANYTRFRGQTFNGTLRNGLTYSNGFDTENTDRIEVAKGPMAVFVGGATLGGIVNLVSKKPQFSRFNELSLKIAEHETYRTAIDSTGPLSKTLAYRVTASLEDGNTWRDFSGSRVVYANPQLLWRPSNAYTGRIEVGYRKEEGNLVSYNHMSTDNYQRDYDSPIASMLDLGRNRTTGPGAGQPFTVLEYQQRIGRSFAQWQRDRFDATGRWHSIGEGEGFSKATWPSGYAANTYGPHAPFTVSTRFIETEHILVATDWLELRGIGRLSDFEHAQSYFNFATRSFPDGSIPLTFGNSSRRRGEDLQGRLEAVLKRELQHVHATILLGASAGRADVDDVGGRWDAASVIPVAGSPNVAFSPATLTGTNVYAYFDPRVHAYPDHRVAQRWADEVAPLGVSSINYGETKPSALYVASSFGFWNDRLTLTGGFRRSKNESYTANLDRARTRIGAPGQIESEADSWTYGVVLEVIKGVNLYASSNEGESVQAGSLVDSFSSLSQPNLITAAERAANPSPNIIGKGLEAGIKFELFDRRITGSIAWFDLRTQNTLVNDTVKTGADPRNIGTEADPNPATANPARPGNVSWSLPIDGNISRGFEWDLVISPTKSYDIIIAGTHMTANLQTVSPPNSSDPLARRNYEILNGRPLSNNPDDMLRVWQHYRFGGQLRGVSVGLGVRYMSSLMPIARDQNWGTIMPSATVADLAVSYTTKISGREVQFQLHVNNVTDEFFTETGRMVAAPREVSLTTRLRF